MFFAGPFILYPCCDIRYTKYNIPIHKERTIRYIYRSFLIFSFLLFFVFPLSAEEDASGYHKLVLDNGATVVCKYMPASPLVTIQIRVMSGLSNEGKYAGSGISHFLEHLLFKGTKGKTSDQIRGQIKAMGGITNASTGLDSAEYHITVPNEKFEDAMILLTDVVMDPVFTEEEIETEREVVLKEIRLRNDDPMTRRMRLLFSKAYNTNVYGHPVIGYEEKFKELNREDVLDYHSSVYTPDRLVMGISGGIPPDEALKAAEEKLEGYRKGDWEAEVYEEPVQEDERVYEFPGDVIVGYMVIGFHTSDLYSPDLYPGDVLSILLGEGNDSRLYKRLVKEKQLLYNVSSLNYTPKYPGLFIITGIGDPGKLEEARREIFSVIEELKKDKIRDSEIERAKNSVISDYLHIHERVKAVASSMTSSQILMDDPAFYEKYVEEIKKLDKKNVARVLKKYLTPGNSTTVYLLPRYLRETWEEKVEAPAGGERRAARKSILPGKRKVSGRPRRRDVRSASMVPVSKMEVSAEGPAPAAEFRTLDNGLRLIVKRKGRLPLVSVAFAVSGGLRAEDRADNGISNLTASLVLKGTERRGEEEIIPVVEELGGRISPFSGMNSIGIKMDLMAADLESGLEVFEDVIRNASFPEEEVIKQREKVIAAIQQQEKDIFENGIIMLRRLLYGKHPYAMRIKGEVPSVEGLQRGALALFYKETFAPEGAVITVVGDVDVEAVVMDLTERFAEWKGKVNPLPASRVLPLERELHADYVMRKEQSLLLVGFQAVRVNDKRKYVLSVISSLLSGADGLLFSALREEEGFTYASGAVNVPGVDPGYFILYAATTEENIGPTGDAVFGVLERIIKGEVTADQIEASKNRLITQHAHSLETNSAMSLVMALDELYGLGYGNYEKYPAEIRSVTRDDIVKCAQEMLNMKKAAIVVIHSSPR